MLKNKIYLKLKILFSLLLIASFLFTLNSCGIYKKTDAKQFPPNPDERVKKNMDEGRGFRLLGKKDRNTGTFDFATSNELWRATLETLDFIPLSNADYGGGIVITDWYTESDDAKESLKISVRFLTNEVRSDSLVVKIFKKNCSINNSCKVLEIKNNLNTEIKIAILKKASFYKSQKKGSIEPYGGKIGDIPAGATIN